MPGKQKAKKRKTIEFQELKRLSFCNSKKLPQVIEVAGERLWWNGFGWVNSGSARGDEVLVVETDTDRRKQKKARRLMLGRYKKTQRGFDIVSFQDAYGCECSLQESSARGDGPLGRLWLGVTDANPKIMKSDAVRLGMQVDGEVSGWMPYPIPEEVLLTTRMHLNEVQVRGLVERLTLWLETGSIAGE